MAAIVSFPGCCTAKIIVDFGQSRASEYGSETPTYESLRMQVKDRIEFVKRVYPGVPLITAITNSEQKIGNKVLRKLGFKGTKWLSKTQHPETKIKMWYYYL